MNSIIHNLANLNNDSNELKPGSTFTIKNSNKIYVLIGYTAERNIVYFEESDNTWINNIQVNSNTVVDNVVYYNNLHRI
jgi:hypothetical protein